VGIPIGGRYPCLDDSEDRRFIIGVSRSSGPVDGAGRDLDQSPSERPMISFMISLVPP